MGGALPSVALSLALTTLRFRQSHRHNLFAYLSTATNAMWSGTHSSAAARAKTDLLSLHVAIRHLLLHLTRARAGYMSVECIVCSCINCRVAISMHATWGNVVHRGTAGRGVFHFLSLPRCAQTLA